MSFQTQKKPILTAVAQAFVLQAMHRQAIAWFMDPELDPRVQNAVATVDKVATLQAAQIANLTLGDRCGAQGLFEANQLSALHVRDLSPALVLRCSHGVLRSPTCVGLLSLRVIYWVSLSVGIFPRFNYNFLHHTTTP